MTRHSPLSDGGQIVFLTSQILSARSTQWPPLSHCRFQCCKCPIVRVVMIPGRHSGEQSGLHLHACYGGKNSFQTRPRPGPYQTTDHAASSPANLNYSQQPAVTSPTHQSTISSSSSRSRSTMELNLSICSLR